MGAKRGLNVTSKSEQMDTQTHGHTNTRTHRRTFLLIESIGPEGQFFEKRDKRGADRDKTGTARDKTGTARVKTGTGV